MCRGKLTVVIVSNIEFNTTKVFNLSYRFFFVLFLHQNISDTDIHSWTDLYTPPLPLLLRARKRESERERERERERENKIDIDRERCRQTDRDTQTDRDRGKRDREGER